MPIADSILEKYKNAKSLSNEYLKFGDGGTAGSVSSHALQALSEAKYELASTSDPMATTLISDINSTEQAVENQLAEDNAYKPPPQFPENAPDENFMPNDGPWGGGTPPDENFMPNDGENYKPSGGDSVDPSQSRLSTFGSSRGLLGGSKATKAAAVRYASGSEKTAQVTESKNDWRIRISVGESSGIFYLGDAGIMEPLKETSGVIFPYTPNITVSYAASYGQQKNTHSNYPSYTYDSSEVNAIQIAGEFTVQTEDEGKYLMASVQFFRAAGKMFYGTGDNAGNPPPILFLNGYGKQYFPNVPCLLTSFSHNMPGDVDYMEIDGTRLPTLSQIQVTLQPVYSRNKVAEFDLEKFAQGGLIDGGFI